MPTTLSNGVCIYNATPHEITFEMDDGSIERVPTDIVIHCKPHKQVKEVNELYKITSIRFAPDSRGQQLIDWVKREYPGVVIVGSIIAAQGYPEEVVMCVPRKNSGRRRSFGSKHVRPDAFSVYSKEK